MTRSIAWAAAAGALTGVLVGTQGCEADACGPTEATVARVIDGDTIELDSGERIRYLMIDTPEITGGKMDCWGEEARQLNADLVEGKTITLRYDEECFDVYDRLLAYIRVNGREINSLMVERGYACVLHIPPNGADRADEFNELEDAAEAAGKGMWGQCDEIACR